MNAEFLDKVLIGEVEAPTAKSFIKEIKRLRDLVKRGKYCDHCCPHCTYCGEGISTDHYDVERDSVIHSDKCDAFNVDGSFKND